MVAQCERLIIELLGGGRGGKSRGGTRVDYGATCWAWEDVGWLRVQEDSVIHRTSIALPVGFIKNDAKSVLMPGPRTSRAMPKSFTHALNPCGLTRRSCSPIHSSNLSADLA